jgi:hypothetical protein
MNDEQQKRALELCDLASRAIDEGPLGWQTGLPIEIGNLRIEQRGFMRMGRRAAGSREDAGLFPDGIDIFYRNTKVLSVGWSSTTSERRVLCYDSGEWEGELELLLAPGHGRTQ